MKEYSNAFKKDYRYSKLIEIFNTGVVYYGCHELEFVRSVREKYGLNIVTSDFSTYHRQFSVKAYFDFDNPEGLEKKLMEETDKCSVGGWSVDSDIFSPEVRELGNSIADDYLKILNYDRNSFSEVIFYPKSFRNSINARSHSLALPEIRSYLWRTFPGIDFWRIIIWYEPSVTCIVDDKSDYRRLIRKQKSIAENCFRIISRFDKFSVLTEKDVGLKILLKSELNDHDRNIYAREIF